MNLFIIPGNPPALHFYKLWAEEIQSEYPEASIHVSPYPHIPAKGCSFSYLDHIANAHGEELLAFHQRIESKPTLIGHSLGGWVALRILEKHHEVIEHCILLYPFLKKPNLKARALLKTLRHLYQIPRFEEFLLFCRSFLERFFEDLKEVSDQELSTSLVLAYHEYKAIGQQKKCPSIPEFLRKKIRMLYCSQDKWCPTHVIEDMRENISCQKTEATHGFITSAKERAIVLKAIEAITARSILETDNCKSNQDGAEP